MLYIFIDMQSRNLQNVICGHVTFKIKGHYKGTWAPKLVKREVNRIAMHFVMGQREGSD